MNGWSIITDAMKHLFPCVLFFLFLLPVLQAATVEELKSAIDKINAEPFTGAATEYIPFAQKQGDALIAAADELLTIPGLSEEDRKYAVETKYWGIALRFGNHRSSMYKELGSFVDSFQSFPECRSLYKILKGSQSDVERDDIYYLEGAEAVKAFDRYVDAYLPFFEKYCQEEDRRQQVSITITYAGLLDPDSSAGLVARTIEKLMPVINEQEKSKEFMTKALTKGIRGTLRRVQMPGKEMQFKAVGTDNKVIDVHDFKGKTVVIGFGLTAQKDMTPLFTKLHNTLPQKDFALIEYDTSYSPSEVIRKTAEDAGIPWIITTRRGGEDKNLDEYNDYYGNFSALFLVGSDGQVIRTWEHSERCYGFWDDLQKLFPVQAEQIKEIGAEFDRLDAEQKAKRAQRQKEFEGEGGITNELLRQFQSMKSADNDLNNCHKKTVMSLLDVVLANPDLPPKQRHNVFSNKVSILFLDAAVKCQNDVNVKPADAFAELEPLLKEWEEWTKQQHLPDEYSSGMVNIKFNMLTVWLNSLRKSSEKLAIAEELGRRFMALAETLAPDANQYVGGEFTHFLWQFLGKLEEIKPDGAERTIAFINQVIPIFEKSKNLELQEYVQDLRNWKRRLSLTGKEFEFECVLLDGKKVNVKDFRGKVVLIDFWATTCGPCIRSFPKMKVQYENYKDKGFEMIAIGGDADVEKLKAFQAKNNYPWFNASQRLSMDAGLKDYWKYYSILGVPWTFIIDRRGNVAYIQCGSDEETLNAALEKVFAE
ncbi:hypothetical protein FACS189419_01900 [Planctomycetales bacterium]|nr:hypothetical protein FACS189419_01900 [Planctomycetales bacterium]